MPTRESVSSRAPPQEHLPQMPPRPERSLRARLQTYCRTKLATALTDERRIRLERYVLGLVDEGVHAPMLGRGLAWSEIAEAVDMPVATVRDLSPLLRPAFDAIARAFPQSRPRPRTAAAKPVGQGFPRPSRNTGPRAATPLAVSIRPPVQPRPKRVSDVATQPPQSSSKRGPKPQPIVEFPDALTANWTDVSGFAAALNLHMARHGDTYWSLHRAIVRESDTFDRTTLKTWIAGEREPRTLQSRDLLSRIERRYRLPAGYFVSKLAHPGRSATGYSVAKRSEQRRLAWHLPADFNTRSAVEQAEILDWVQTVVVSGGTDYRRYQALAAKHRFALRFPVTLLNSDGRASGPRTGCNLDAPPDLANEMSDLLSFKTAPLTALGYQRNGVWGSDTAAQKVEHLSLLFGAFAADPEGPVRGYGIAQADLCFGMLVFPSVWDRYLRWRYQRRGFYTAWELDMLAVAMSLTRKEWGWIRQTPKLADRLVPIDGLITEADVAEVRSDWPAACDRLFEYARSTSREIKKISKVHRDPFEPIIAVLEADSPLREYLKIADEIARLMPCETQYPKAAAETVRSFLMIRLGLHLGVRQRNLRQLLLCPKGMPHRSERSLAAQRRGELRWHAKDNAWEVLIPSDAFKNADSSFFGGKPFRLKLPDVGGLYGYLEAYIDRHRAVLLANAPDPGTLFIKSISSRSGEAAYNQTTFYEAWRLIIQRYGIYNPYTGRGAIEGLLPHGPHNVRDVLATHVLKRTGSYQQASYAIQDTPEMVAKHYGRFLPEDKAAMAAQILNQVWEAA